MSFLTPEIADLLRAAIESYLSEMHVCLPGQIVSYDSATGLAKVKPLLMKKVVGESGPREMGIISNVPVIFPRAGVAVLRLPVAAGTLCALLFSERSLDRWLNNGGVVDPAINTKFHYNDAIAVPGLYPGTQPAPHNGADTSLEIAVGTNYIEIKTDGEIVITTANKVTINAPHVNLGDDTGSSLIRTLDVSSIIAPSGGGPCTLSPGAGTIKTKAS